MKSEPLLPARAAKARIYFPVRSGEGGPARYGLLNALFFCRTSPFLSTFYREDGRKKIFGIHFFFFFIVRSLTYPRFFIHCFFFILLWTRCSTSTLVIPRASSGRAARLKNYIWMNSQLCCNFFFFFETFGWVIAARWIFHCGSSEALSFSVYVYSRGLRAIDRTAVKKTLLENKCSTPWRFCFFFFLADGKTLFELVEKKS